jgi:hypothetical protein
MKDLGRLSYLSYLDLICCGFGASLLMFLIVISADAGARPEEANATLIVRCRHESGRHAAVGIEFQAPGSDEWRHDVNLHFGDGIAFSATSEPDSGGDALLILTNPQPGQWHFRPFLKDYSKSKSTMGELEVRLEILGQPSQPKFAGSTLTEIGGHGNIVSISLPSSQAPRH